MAEMFEIARGVVAAVTALGADGANLICNLGEAAGQTVEHLHMHVVPRVSGDLSDARKWLNPDLWDLLRQPTSAECSSMRERMVRVVLSSVRSVRTGSSCTPRSNGYLVYPGVVLGEGCILEVGVIIGCPPSRLLVAHEHDAPASVLEPAKTSIGARARIRSGTAVYCGAEIGSDFDCGHNVIVREDTRIGDAVYVLPNTQIHAGARIGDSATVCGFVCSRSVIEGGAKVFGSLVHRYESKLRGEREASPRVCAEAFVGFGAVIVGGITIGRGVHIEPNAVVVRDVPDGARVVSVRGEVVMN
jgi:serine acetyltransferase